MSDAEQTADGDPLNPEYIAYSGMDRRPGAWGIPYMVGLAIMCFALLGGTALSLVFGPLGWLFSLTGLPLLLFAKQICADDDRAVEILLIEAKWALIKAFGGITKHFGGTMTLAPTTYGRKLKDAKRFFEQPARW